MINMVKLSRATNQQFESVYLVHVSVCMSIERRQAHVGMEFSNATKLDATILANHHEPCLVFVTRMFIKCKYDVFL